MAQQLADITMFRSFRQLIDEKKLNRFLSLDWPQIERDLHEINQGIIELEKLAAMIEKTNCVLGQLNGLFGVLYEEKHGKPLFCLDNLEDA